MMEYERRELLKEVAKRVADELWADALAGKLKAVGIDAIRERLKLNPIWRDENEYDQLEEFTTRHLVEKVG